MLPGFHYDTSNSGLHGTNVWGFPNNFVITRISPFAQPYTNLTFTSSLAVAGTIALVTTTTLAGSWECNNCEELRSITGGGVTSTAAPEPATWALLIMGFGAAGAGLRRRKMLAA